MKQDSQHIRTIERLARRSGRLGAMAFAALAATVVGSMDKPTAVQAVTLGGKTNIEMNAALQFLARTNDIPMGAQLQGMVLTAQTAKALGGKDVIGANLTGLTNEGTLVETNFAYSHSRGGLRLGQTYNLVLDGGNHCGADMRSLRGAKLRNGSFSGSLMQDLRDVDAGGSWLMFNMMDGVDATGGKFLNTEMAYSSARGGVFDHADARMQSAPEITAARFKYAMLNDPTAALAVQKNASLGEVAQIGDTRLDAQPEPVTHEQVRNTILRQRKVAGLSFAA